MYSIGVFNLEQHHADDQSMTSKYRGALMSYNDRSACTVPLH